MTVALVGPVLPGVENHSLDVLAEALDDQAIESCILPFFGFQDLEGTTRAVLASGADLCGISIQSTEGALASLSLAWWLRQRGFAGHVVCGGHFATLNAEEILASPAGVDSVVRFAGQEALLGLARGARTPAQLAALPGIVFRASDGATVMGAPGRPVEDGDLRARRRRPLPRHLGFPAADLVASHGCQARCAYCCVAATSALEAHERTRAGQPRAGEERDVEAIAGEIAVLHHDRGARVFNFMDDNLLPLEPAEALRWLRAFGAALGRRRVGRIAFSLQLRADVVTEPVADALAALGLVRAYVGIDGTSPGQLRALGRRAPAGAGAQALERLSRRGIFCVCNSLLVGPTFHFEAVRAEIDSLAELRGAPLHLLPLDVRAGTGLDRRARAEGLIEGSFLYRRYRFLDRRTERFGRVITSLPTRLEERSVPIALYDLGYNLGIARRLAPALAPTVERLAALYAEVAAAWNTDQVRVLRLAVVAAETGEAAVEDLIRVEAPRVRAHDEALLARCDEALDELEAAASRALGRPAPAHARGHLIALALSAGLAACSHRGTVHVYTDGPVEADSAADVSGFRIPDVAPTLDTASDPPPPYDAHISTDAACATSESRSLRFGVDFNFPDAGLCADGTAANGTVTELRGCVQGCGSTSVAHLTFDAAGVLTAVEAQESAIAACVMHLLGKSCYPSLACRRADLMAHCWVA